MNLYLFNQKRNRDLNEYLDKLCISTEDFCQLIVMKKILLVGGGNSTIQEYFAKNKNEYCKCGF